MIKDKNLVVIGLGYVGLPVAVLAQKKGWTVTGLDIDQKKVDIINNQESPIEDELLESELKQYPVKATTNPSCVENADFIIVAVPTPVHDDYSPDLRPLKNALQSITPHLKAGQVLSIESTINPGVMDEVIKPLVSSDVVLVHCPERVNPGDTKWTVANIPRVIGGYEEDGVMKAKEYYESILDADIMIMQSVKEAESVKILENTFRDINIAFVNEMAQSFDKLDIDIKNVIAGASTKPFAFMPHFPGNGVGGHCISVDPYYMIERGRQAGFDHKFLKLAREINNSMPAYTVSLLEKFHPTKIALLGLAYKKNIDDTRESPALEILELLKEKQYKVSVFDPHVPDQSTVSSLDEALESGDAIILATDHDEFTSALTPDFLKSKNIKTIIDGKNALNKTGIITAGINYHGIGR